MRESYTPGPDPRWESPRRQVVLQVGSISLDQLAPLFIPEEERLVPILVIQARNEKRATHVAAEDIVVQLRARGGDCFVLILVAICIEGSVTVELPESPMEGLCAALE